MGAVNRGGGGTISEFIRNQAKRRIKNGLLCQRCFTNLNWDILFYNSVHYAKTPAMKKKSEIVGTELPVRRDESNSIKGTVVRDGFLA